MSQKNSQSTKKTYNQDASSPQRQEGKKDDDWEDVEENKTSPPQSEDLQK